MDRRYRRTSRGTRYRIWHSRAKSKTLNDSVMELEAPLYQRLSSRLAELRLINRHCLSRAASDISRLGHLLVVFVTLSIPINPLALLI